MYMLDPIPKKNIIFIHGFMGCAQEWNPVIKLINANTSCLALTLPFHAKEYATEITNFKDLTRFIYSKLTHLKKPLTLIGYSLGGRIATHYALEYPNHIEKLILESTNLGLQTIPERKKRIKHDKKLSNDLLSDYSKFLDHWYKKPLWGNLVTNSNYTQLINRKLEEKPQALAKALTTFSLGKQKFLLPKLIKSKIPTLLITGDQDKKYSMLATNYKKKETSC